MTKKIYLGFSLALLSMYGAMNAQKSSPLQKDLTATVEDNEYLLIGKSMFNAEGENVWGSGGYPVYNPVFIDFNDEASKVTFRHLFRDEILADQLPFDLSWDSETRTITAPTPTDFSSPDECVVVGEGADIIISLSAGYPYGIGYWKSLDEMVMNVREDRNVILPASGFGLARNWYDDWFEEYSFDALYDALYDVGLFKRANGIAIYANVEVIDFGKTFVNTVTTGDFRVVNAGTEQADFVLSCSDDAFKPSVTSGCLMPGEYIDVEVVFQPTTTGEITGSILIDTEDSSATIALKGISRYGIDYSPIVSSGYEYMRFTTGNEYPFELNSELTGFPVAVSTNAGEGQTKSWLEVQVDVPENQSGMFKWSGFFNPRWAVYDYFKVTDNGEEVYATPEDSQYVMEIGSEIPLASGSHTIVFTYEKDVIVNPHNVQLGEDYAYISAISFDESTGASAVPADKIAERVYFTIDGKTVSNPSKGLYIVRDVMKDGSIKTYKKILNNI